MKKITIALISGILMGLTPAPTEGWYLAWIALIPLWILIKQVCNYSLPQTFLLGLVWGCGYHGLALFWITGVHPMTWMGVPWLASLAIALFCWIFITLWGAILVSIWSVGVGFYQRFNKLKQSSAIDSLLTILFGVALWCGLEFLWSQGDLWWTSLSYSQSPHNLAILQLTQISGPATVTASIVLVNGLIAEAIIIKKQSFKIKKPFLITSCILLISLHLLGLKLYNRPVAQPPEKAIKVGIIQGNIPNEIKLYTRGWRKALAGYTNGYQNLADRGVDIVLTPETALPYFWDNLVRNRSAFYEAILDKKVPVWIGAFGREGDRYTNSLFTITGEGNTYSRYDKVKLVPLGEYIPFENILGKLVDRLS
ncbi:MAG: apolipoprotein N-acyltransferase, partial [Prochloraceae cyanobacterium]